MSDWLQDLLSIVAGGMFLIAFVVVGVVPWICGVVWLVRRIVR